MLNTRLARCGYVLSMTRVTLPDSMSGEHLALAADTSDPSSRDQALPTDLPT
jgi:hypothetical protein